MDRTKRFVALSTAVDSLRTWRERWRRLGLSESRTVIGSKDSRLECRLSVVEETADRASWRAGIRPELPFGIRRGYDRSELDTGQRTGNWLNGSFLI